MADELDLYLDQGADYSITLTMINTDGSAMNIADYQFSGQVKVNYFTPWISANLDVSVTDASNGVLTISLDSANTANMKAGEYLYDVLYINTMNTTTKLVKGKIYLNGTVTGITPPDDGSPAL